MQIQDILNKTNLDKSDIIALLSADSKENTELIRSHAYQIMKDEIGEDVFLRGLIEFSNICINDCNYCGIRKSNKNINRYTLDKQEIIDAAIWCANQGYGSVVLQSGERQDEKFTDFIEDIVKTIKQASISETLPVGLGITLCVGEQDKSTYQRWFDAGAHRYLLRIESSSRKLFSDLHPAYQSYDRRIECLNYLKEVGYQVGTGIMIGIPEQTYEDLANDILFFKKLDVDMIGMGPFIVHNQTPMSNLSEEYATKKESIYKLALKMIAVTRIVLRNVNIASTTALQAMYPLGREAGLSYGANIIMPQLTPTRVRKEYQLYEGKPCLDEIAEDCFYCIDKRIESSGRTIGYNKWGDSQHFENGKAETHS